MTRLGLWILGRKTTRGKVPFYPLSRVHSVNRSCLCGCWPWSRGCRRVCQVSPLRTVNVHPLPSHPPFAYCFFFFLGVAEPSDFKGVGREAPQLWGWAIYVNYLGFFCMGDLSLPPFIYSVISLCQYRLMDTCFILWVVIWHYLFWDSLSFGHRRLFTWFLCPFSGP